MPSGVFFDRFRLLSKLGEGSFGKIYKGIDTISNKLVAIKVETEKGSNNHQLKIEAKVYKSMEGTPISKTVFWPKLHNFGKDENTDNYIMIMDLLGPNIDVLLNKTSHNCLTPISVAYLAEKMITLLEHFHRRGFVHRDLKPQNFVIEYCENNFPLYTEVFLIDYGLAKSYVESDQKTHTPFIQKRSLKGTVRYSSINTHLGIEQSRRDDMQSLGYIFVYMLQGRLPWQNLMKDRSKKEAYHHIMIMKMKTNVENLTKDIHPSIRIPIMSYLLYVNSLMFHEEPNYEYCRSLFYSLATKFTGNLFKGSI